MSATLEDGSPLVKGKRVTGFTNEEEQAAGFDRLMPFLLEDRLRERGATFVAAPKWADQVEWDGPLITGQNPQSSVSTAGAVIEAIEEQAEARTHSRRGGIPRFAAASQFFTTRWAKTSSVPQDSSMR